MRKKLRYQGTYWYTSSQISCVEVNMRLPSPASCSEERRTNQPTLKLQCVAVTPHYNQLSLLRKLWLHFASSLQVVVGHCHKSSLTSSLLDHRDPAPSASLLCDKKKFFALHLWIAPYQDSPQLFKSLPWLQELRTGHSTPDVASLALIRRFCNTYESVQFLINE